MTTESDSDRFHRLRLGYNTRQRVRSSISAASKVLKLAGRIGLQGEEHKLEDAGEYENHRRHLIGTI
jgi:hypothetical protein